MLTKIIRSLSILTSDLDMEKVFLICRIFSKFQQNQSSVIEELLK